MITYCTLNARENELFSEIPLMASENRKQRFPLRAIVSLKSAGDMGYALKDKTSNRKNFFESLGIAGKVIFTVNQGHTKEIIQIKEKNKPGDFSTLTADGFVTDLDWPILGVTVADCVPILIFSKQKQAYGILHSGWKGTGIIENAIEIFSREYGIKPQSLSVCLGPAIESGCYPVAEERAQDFQSRFGNNTIDINAGRYYVDLRQANINLLHRRGVQDIKVIRDCTYCNPLLSSFRRDGEEGLVRMLVLLGPLSTNPHITAKTGDMRASTR